MALLRECLLALRETQRQAGARDDPPPVEAERADSPHRAAVAGQTASPSDRSGRKTAERQAAPQRGER